MPEPVRSIVEAVLRLSAEQRRELLEALVAVEASRPSAGLSRQELVDSIKGKYRHIPTSSESFISQKREDAVRESS